MKCFEKYYPYVKLAGGDALYDHILIPKPTKLAEKLGKDHIDAYEDDIGCLPDIKSEEIDSMKQNLLVFDDMNEESKAAMKRIEEYFTKARTKNCSLVLSHKTIFQFRQKYEGTVHIVYSPILILTTIFETSGKI